MHAVWSCIEHARMPYTRIYNTLPQIAFFTTGRATHFVLFCAFLAHQASQTEIQNLELATTTIVVTLVFITTAAETAVGNWLNTYALKAVGLGEEKAAIANSAFWGAFTVGRVVAVSVVLGHRLTQYFKQVRCNFVLPGIGGYMVSIDNAACKHARSMLSVSQPTQAVALTVGRVF